ncbi:MAG: single-stranded-DNA-specific exonuclease RecJ [Clostridia bacterium]|nr:single-stranded-DNA-specific exonuclease RecJ [Clostridia bacterium]
MIDKIWRYKDTKISDAVAVKMSRDLKIPRIIAKVLLNRGINSDGAMDFIKKSMQGVINPMLLTDMDKAVNRILLALKNNEQITVYGDYDVDGITSTAMVYEFLKEHGANVSYYIPARADEGYGINIMAVNKLRKSGTKLLITVDCGITAIGEVEFARLQGMDVIITDHHTCKERLPEAAAAIINPKRPDSDYPFDALAGVGVAFKLILALTMALKESTNECFSKYVDIVAIGTIADVVSLTGENRIIVDRGLISLKNTQRPGLIAIKEVSGADQKPINATVVAFAIAPRLNAAGRLGTATTAVELLLTKDIDRAREIAAELDNENRERQETEQEIFAEALDMISKDANFDKKKVIVLAHEDWHGGVIGIVASRLCERYYKPCILISHSNGIGKGSGRSIKGFNLFDALSYCEDCLTEFGGHSVAAGLNVNMSDLDRFITKINKYADGVLTPDLMVPSVDIDCKISPDEATLENARLISSLEPFGMGNEKPIFSLEGVTVSDIATIGNDNKHLRMRFMTSSGVLNAIGFGFGAAAEKFKVSDCVDVAFTLDINNYNNKNYLQLVIKDIKCSE